MTHSLAWSMVPYHIIPYHTRYCTVRCCGSSIHPMPFLPACIRQDRLPMRLRREYPPPCLMHMACPATALWSSGRCLRSVVPWHKNKRRPENFLLFYSAPFNASSSVLLFLTVSFQRGIERLNALNSVYQYIAFLCRRCPSTAESRERGPWGWKHSAIHTLLRFHW